MRALLGANDRRGRQARRPDATFDTRRFTAWGPVGLVLLVAVAGFLGGTSRAWAQTEKLPKAKDIIDKSIEAQGGRAAMEKLHARVSKGTFEIVGQGIKGPVTSYEAAPNKQYAMIELEGMGKLESGTDGEVYWELNAMIGPRLLEGAEKALNARQTTFNAALYWQKLYQKAECVGVEEIDGRPCFKVVFTPQEGDPETIYYDRKTYLPVKVELVLKSPMGVIPLAITPSDYKKVDGVLLPHKVTQDIAGVQQTVVTVTSIEHNVKTPADRFALPEKVKELVEKSKAEKKDDAGEKKETP